MRATPLVVAVLTFAILPAAAGAQQRIRIEDVPGIRPLVPRDRTYDVWERQDRGRMDQLDRARDVQMRLRERQEEKASRDSWERLIARQMERANSLREHQRDMQRDLQREAVDRRRDMQRRQRDLQQRQRELQQRLLERSRERARDEREAQDRRRELARMRMTPYRWM